MVSIAKLRLLTLQEYSELSSQFLRKRQSLFANGLLKLALNTLAEVATTEYSRQSNPTTMAESQRIAQEGGDLSRNARETMEKRLGRSVVSPEKASEHIKVIDTQ